MAKKSDIELQAYLDDLRTHGIRSKAARAAGMTLRTVMQYAEADQEFAEEERLAQVEASDYLEEEARRRAVDGVPVYKMFMGEQVEVERKYSDSLLSKLLDGALPEKYAVRTKNEHSGPEGAPITLDDTAASARIASLLLTAKARRTAEADAGDLLE